MGPIWANPAGLWVLLGVPALLAIHFLQQRARVARTSTWFLIETLAPDSARGRNWDRLRASRSLWLQLAAVLLAAWVLGEPRWLRSESTQTVVIVLDASAAMEAFRAPALAAAERELRLADGLAARTTWIAMTSHPRQPPLYRGPDRTAASAALARWQPELGRHDVGPALRLARTLAGGAGRTLFITDARAKVPPGQRAAGVGQPIENVGFAGATVTPQENGYVWRALVKNHASTPQRREWHLEIAGEKSPTQAVELAAGAIAELSARLPDGVDRATVVLSDDGFTTDNRLPLVVPAPKPLAVIVEGSDAAAEFFRALAASVDGVKLTSAAVDLPAAAVAGLPLTLKLARLSDAEVGREPRGGVFWPPADQRTQAPLLRVTVTPERDPLVADLNWQGWLGTGPHGYAAAAGDRTLLWHGPRPMVFVRTAASGPGVVASPPMRKLLLAFDWGTSNAARLPATVLLVRRFLEAERDAQFAPYAANFDGGAPVAIVGGPIDGEWSVTYERAGAPGDEPAVVVKITAAERREFRAPGRPGFFTVRRGDEIMVRGSAQFADARQGDFRDAEKFFLEIHGERETAIERNTYADPWVPVWLLLLGAIALASGWQRGGSAASAEMRPATTP